MEKTINQAELREMAKQIRRDIITMLAAAGSGHPGGSLSAVEIITYLYFQEMRLDVENSAWPERDRFVLSKGHAAPLLYAVLARRGFFPHAELRQIRKINCPLQGHPDMQKVPGVDMSTGSLGQGISTAVGMALAGKIDQKDYRVFALLGDGEIQEGQVWEAAMAAAHYQLDNLIAFLDYNGLQIDGPVTKVMSPEPVLDKFKAFGWQVKRIQGHSFGEIAQAVEWAKKMAKQPVMIIADTVKGKGVSFMENQVNWHGNAPSEAEAARALAELV